MPHYSDGTPATVGDLVSGKPSNFGRTVVGEVIQITAGDTCNCIVAFVDAVEIPNKLNGHQALKTLSTTRNNAEGHPEQVTYALIPSYDYGETKAFTKVGGNTRLGE